MASLNRKGVFFTLLAIIIVSIFIISLSFFSGFLLRNSAQERVRTLDNFVISIEEDLPRQLFANGFRTIFLMGNQIISTGNYIVDTQGVFQESFFNGTFSGQEESLLFETTFDDISAKFSERGSRVNANVVLSSPVLSVDQIDPWHVRFSLNANLYVYDLSGLASWNRSVESFVLIPIEGFSDPLYLVNSNGIIVNKFVSSPYPFPISGENYSPLVEHIEGPYYISSSSAPSFLQRLEGDFSASVYGIESLVDLGEFSRQGIPVQQKSIVDYIYFSSNNPSSCVVSGTGLPSWFRLDNFHLSVYGVNC